MVKYVAALDIGTTGLRMLVGKITDSGSTHIIAKSTVSCKSVRKFQITDEQELIAAIRKLLKKIEEQTDIIVKSTYVSIQSAYVGYVRNTAVINTEEDGVITAAVIADLLDKTSDIELYEDEHLIDVIPIKYIIDVRQQSRSIRSGKRITACGGGYSNSYEEAVADHEMRLTRLAWKSTDLYHFPPL